MNISKHLPGMFSWAEVATPDAAESSAFYTRLLGLAATEMQTDDGSLYTILKKDGRDVCGLYATGEEEIQRVSSDRAVWRTYFTVDSVDDGLARVRALGGTVVHEPVAIGTDGRLAVAQDPTGAAFTLWETRDHAGAQAFREPGALTWTELYTRDTRIAAFFYGSLFGWGSNTSQGPGGPYTVYMLDEEPVAGMIAISDDWGPMPPHWCVYFQVTDLDASRARTGELGAGEFMPPIEVEGVGRFVFLHDPQGAVVALIEPAGEGG